MKKTSFFYSINLIIVVAAISQLNAQITKAYVGTGYGTGVDIVDVDSMTVIGSIPDAGGYRMVLSLDGKKLYSTGGDYYIYISDTQADTLITVFDPSQGVFDTYELEGISLSPDGSRVYVTDEYTDNIFVLETATDTIIARASLSFDEAEDNIVSPDGLYLYVNDNDSVSKISTENLTIVDKAYAGNDGHGVTISNDGSKIYAEGRDDNTFGVIVVNAATMTVDTVLDASGYHLETSHDGTRVFGVNESRTLSIIDVAADTVFAEFEFLDYFGIAGLSESADGNYILLSGRGGLVKIDGTTYSEIDGLTGGGYRSVVIKEASPVVLNNIPDVVFPEDIGNQTISGDVRTIFSQPPSGNIFTYSSVSDNPEITTAINEFELSINPAPNYYGSANIQLIAENIVGYQAIDTFVVTITPVNDPPQIVNLPDTLFFIDDGDTVLLMNEFAIDVDTPDSLLQWSFQKSNENMAFTYDSTSTNLSMMITELWYNEYLICTVMDDSMLTAIDTIVFINSETTRINNLSNLIPSEFMLLQNYPNPFNPTTTINFSIPKASYITLKLYNQLGQVIETLISEDMVAGSYNYVWDASGYASGVYYYKLETNSGFVQIKKSILLK